MTLNFKLMESVLLSSDPANKEPTRADDVMIWVKSAGKFVCFRQKHIYVHTEASVGLISLAAQAVASKKHSCR